MSYFHFDGRRRLSISCGFNNQVINKEIKIIKQEMNLPRQKMEDAARFSQPLNMLYLPSLYCVRPKGSSGFNSMCKCLSSLQAKHGRNGSPRLSRDRELKAR